MINCLAVILLLSAVVLNPGNKEQGASIPHSNPHEQTTQPVPAPIVVNHVSQSAPTKKAYSNQPPHWYTSPEWWLVIFGFPTLIFIAWQAYETHGTAIAAKKSADAALIQIRAVKDSKRARLIIRIIDKPEIGAQESILEDSRPLRVRCFVENAGRSKAFNIRAFGMTSIVSDPDKGTYEDGFLQQFPQIIDEGDIKYPLNLTGMGREVEDYASTSDCIVISEEIARQLREGKRFVQASGLLMYEDIFCNSHTTPFRFVWKSRGDDDGKTWLTRSTWIDYSPPST